MGDVTSADGNVIGHIKDDDDVDLLNVAGVDKMRITGRMQRMERMMRELTDEFAAFTNEMRALKAKADAFDKMARTFKGIKEE